MISLIDGLRAAAERQPGALALVQGDERVSYAELIDRIAEASGKAGTGTTSTCAVDAAIPASACVEVPPAGAMSIGLLIEWLSIRARASLEDENAPAFHGLCAGSRAPWVLSDRDIVLRLFNACVTYRCFTRDTQCAIALPPLTPEAIVAHLLPLWLGATAHLYPPGALPAIAKDMAHGPINQCWLGESELLWLDEHVEPLPAPAPGFMRAVCVRPPSSVVARRLIAWLGAPRVSAQISDPQLGPVSCLHELSGPVQAYTGIVACAPSCVA